MRQRDLIYAGARMAMDGCGVTDKQRGDAFGRIDDLLKIRNLNNRATAEWTRQNNTGANWPAGAYEASDRKQERCWEHAKRIAAARGWRLEAPGLWWIVREKTCSASPTGADYWQDITPRE